MGFGIREGRRQAKENLSSNDDGECARCGGNSAPSSIPGYLQCVKCAYEWSDPDAEGFASGPRDSISRDSEKLAVSNIERIASLRSFMNDSNPTDC